MDSKQAYSDESASYVAGALGASSENRRAYERSKNRELKYNERWKKQSVNLNEIVDRFAPGSFGRQLGPKFVYEGSRYKVFCDMAAGYLRIWDRKNRWYVDLQGNRDKHNRAHYKIKRREEM